MRVPGGGRPRLAGLLTLLLLTSFALRLGHGSFLLDGSRYYDEQYSMRNAASILIDGTWIPSNVFYPSLSYMPQTAVLAASEGLHRLTGIPALTIYADTADGFGGTAYFLARGVAALFGTLSLLALYLLGRRLFDPWVGFWAAALWSAMPPHLATSAIFKPDILVALFTVTGFAWCLDAVESLEAGNPARRATWKAGAAVGLAVAAKYTGVGLAIPLTAGTLWGHPLDRRRWGRLVLAGIASILTFIALNPFLLVVLRYVPRLWRIGQQKAEVYDSTPFDVAWGEVLFLWHHHGPVVFAFAIVGLVGLGVMGLGTREGGWLGEVPASRRRAARMILAYVLGYSLLYALGGQVFRGQNYVPVGAFTSLAAAWVGLGLWRRLGARLGAARPSRRSWVAVPVGAVLLLALLLVPARLAYREAVPSTFFRAERILLDRWGEEAHLRLAYYERGEIPLRAWVGRNRAITVPLTEGLPEVGTEALDRADLEIFAGKRLDGPEADFHLRRLGGERVGEILRLSPELFRAWGPEIVLVFHPWELVGEPRPLAPRLLPVTGAEAGPNRFLLDLGDAPPGGTEAGGWLSLAVWLPLERGRPRPREVRLGGETAVLFETWTGGRRARYLTSRVPVPPGAREIPVVFDDKVTVSEPPEGELLLWSPPGSGAGP